MKISWQQRDYMAPQGPIHDQHCRCPGCKPPLVGAARYAIQVKLLLIAAAAASGILAAFLV